MFSWRRKKTEKPNHPMFSLAEARRLLDGLRDADALKGLKEVTSWLESITETPGFPTELRIDLIKLLDETGQPFHAELLQNYLAEPHLQDFQGVHLWEGMRAHARELARAYEACAAACRQEGMKPGQLHALLALLSARLLRATTEHMKLELMRYMDVGRTTWERMFRCYSGAETGGFTDATLSAYPGDAVLTSPRRELMRALALHESSPGNLAPEQIEVCARIAGRMADCFDLTRTADAGSEYCIDLAQPHAPRTLDASVAATPATRYFSTLRALPGIAEIIVQHERGGAGEERRFGGEFTPQGKLTVLKHLLVRWDKGHPQRRLKRSGLSSNIEVVRSFRVISKLVPHFDLNQARGISEEEAAALAIRSKTGPAPDGEGNGAPETWTVVDASPGGIGATIPAMAGAWVKIGSLCGLKALNADMWWVGVIRRLHADTYGVAHVGIEILGKRSLGVWLRFRGTGAGPLSDWRTGPFRHEYFPAILLPDAQNSYMDATLLLESGSYARRKLYDIMLGQNSREIELTGLLAEGEDYELVKFRWLTA